MRLLQEIASLSFSRKEHPSFAERMQRVPVFFADHEGTERFAQIVHPILSERTTG
jgi:hypothetical protein